MDQRGLFWPDVESAIDDAREARSPGTDRYGRPMWNVRGPATTGDEIEIVCAIETDASGTEFITLYWSD
jgi:hypothetical protein